MWQASLTLLAFAALMNFLMGAVVLRRFPRSALHVSYSCATFFLGIWTVLDFLWVYSSEFQTLFLDRVSFACFPVMCFFVLMFAALAPRHGRQFLPRWTGWMALVCTAFGALGLSPYAVRGLKPGGWGSESVFGPGFWPLALFGLGMFFAAIVILHMKFRAARDPFDRARLRLLVVGVWVPFMVCPPLFFVPYFFGGSGVFDKAPALVPAFSVLTMMINAYAIMRYQLFDMREFQRRVFVAAAHGVIHALFIGAAVRLIFVTSKDGVFSPRFAVLMAVIFLLSLFYMPVHEALSKLAMRRIFRATDDIGETMRLFGRRIARTQPLDELATDICEFLRKAFLASGAAVYSYDSSRVPGLSAVAGSPESFGFEFDEALTDALVTYCETTPRTVTRYEVEVRGEGHALHGFLPFFIEKGVEIVMPLVSAGRCMGGIFIARSADGYAYSDELLRRLESLADVVVPALLNAVLNERIEVSHRRYQELFERAGDALLLVSGREMSIHETNSRALDLFGCGADELLGKPLSRLVPPDQRGRLERLLEEAPRRAEGIQEIFLVRRNGETFPAELFAVRLQSDVTVINLRDRTQTRELERQLLQAQKMEAIGSLAEGIANDFNVHLSSITGYLSLLRPGRGEEATRRAAELIERSVGLASDLNRRLLEFTRGEKYAIERVSAAAALKRAIELVTPTCGSAIRIDYHLPDEACVIEGNRARLEQVFVNLFLNACENMPSGGTLTAATGIVEAEEAKAPGFAPDPDAHYLKLTVADSGLGIEPEHIRRIFDPYFTTHLDGSGAGLGLAMVYRAVKDHHGDIRVHSEPGRGTRFEVFLPIADSAGEGMRRPNRGATVLVVDDEARVRAVCANMLSFAGYNVVAARDGIGAVELLSRTPDGFQLVILDQYTPGVSAAHTCGRIREIRPDIPILVASDNPSDKGSVAELAALGVTAVVRKPYTVNQLLASVAEILK